MKVLIVNTDLDIGGGENSLVSFLNNFDLEKYQVDLGLLQPKLGMIHRIDKRINIIKLYEKPLLCDYDVAIGYKQGKSSNFVANKVNAKKKTSIFRHGSIKYTGIRKYIYGKYYKKFDYIITLNEDLREKFSKHFNIDKNKIKIIKDLFDKDDFINKSLEYEINKDSDFVFTTVSRIVPVKKIDFIPIIGKRLKEKNIDFKWYILGDYKDKKYYNSIINLTQKYGLGNNIFYLGNVENPMPYYKVSDIYIHLSEVESWCRSITEALIMQVPVLSTDTIGGKAQIISGYNGEICQINNIDDAFNKLVYMIENINKINMPEYIQDNKSIMEEYYKLFE